MQTTAITPTMRKAAEAEFRWLLRESRAPRLRLMHEFAESELVIAKGPHPGKFKASRQPVLALWFAEIASRRWRRHVATGPSQAGKTLGCFVTPILYHLFEIGESVSCLVPDEEIASDKWTTDILPAIEATQYRELLPRSGAGSRGGAKIKTIRFRNGRELIFRTGKGSDKTRAGFTTRVLVVTETDGMDEAGESSRESDPIEQMLARLRSYGSNYVVYLECTVSTEDGRTWQEYQAGTCSLIMCRCPHCLVFVAPEREHLVGWQDAPSKLQAAARAAFGCPACGALWTEAERRAMVGGGVLVHRGQEVTPAGQVVGPLPETDTLGFRWSAFHNLFQPASEIGADEWAAARAKNPEAAEKKMRQFVWCLPTVAERSDFVPLDQDQICQRQGATARGIPPPGTRLTMGIDIGKFVGHWVVIAWTDDAVGTVIDYGAFDITSHNLATDVAIMAALLELRDVIESGWAGVVPELVWIDSGFETKAVYEFTLRAGNRYRPTKGFGTGKYGREYYRAPEKLTPKTPLAGEGWHVSYQESERVWLIDIDADKWKTRVHESLTCPAGGSGSLVLFQSPPHAHLTYARHLTAEKKVEEFVPERGMVIKWLKVRKQNHWLDTTSLAEGAANFLGIKPLKSTSSISPPRHSPPAPLTTPDGRPFLITERD